MSNNSKKPSSKDAMEVFADMVLASLEEAEKNLREAIELYIESFGADDIKRPHRPIITTVSIEIPGSA